MVASGDLDHWVVLSGRYFEYLRAAISSIMMRSSSLPTGLCESSHLRTLQFIVLGQKKTKSQGQGRTWPDQSRRGKEKTTGVIESGQQEYLSTMDLGQASGCLCYWSQSPVHPTTVWQSLPNPRCSLPTNSFEQHFLLLCHLIKVS